jgi:hypothetical protein
MDVVATTVTPASDAAHKRRAAAEQAAGGARFPWAGFLLIVVSIGLIGPLSRHAHHVGIEVDHATWGKFMSKASSGAGGGSGSAEQLLLHAARDGDARVVRGSLRRGADPDTQEATVRAARACVHARVPVWPFVCGVC